MKTSRNREFYIGIVRFSVKRKNHRYNPYLPSPSSFMETRSVVLPVPVRLFAGAFSIFIAGSLLFFLSISQAHAASRYWVSDVGKNASWNGANNWAATQGGAKGASVPGVDDVAIFTSSNSGNTVRIQQSAAVFIKGLVLMPSFTGAVHVGTGHLTVGTNGVLVSSGYLLSTGNGVFNSTGSFVQTGGTVRIKNLSLSGSFTAQLGGAGQSAATSASGYVFSSTRTVTFNNGSADQTVTIGASGASFSALTLNLKGGTTVDDLIVNASGGLAVSGALTITLGNLDLNTSNSTLRADGGITVANNAQASLTTDQNMAISGSLTVNASSVLTVTAGTTTFIDDSDINVKLDDQALYNVTLNTTSPAGISVGSGIVVDTGAFSASGSLTVTNGRLDLGGRQLTVSGSITVASDGDARLTATGRVYLGGSLTHGVAGGVMLTGGTLVLNNNADQTIEGRSIASRFASLTIANTGSGSADDIIWRGAALTVSGALTITTGNLDLATSDVAMRLDGGLTMANDAQASLTTDANMSMSGTVNLATNSVLTVTAGTTTLNDDGPQSIDLDDQYLHNVTLNILTTGTENGAAHVEPGTSFIASGSLTVTKGDLRLFGKTLTVSGSVTVADDGQASLVATGTVGIGGNVTQNFAGGLMLTGATLTLNGQADQTIAVKSPATGWRLGALTINNDGSAFGGSTFDDVVWTGATLAVSGALTITRGNLDLNVHNRVLLADGGITLASDSEAQLTTDQNISASGSFVVGASAVMLLSGGTVTFNDDGNMEVDLDDQELYNVTLNLIPITAGEDNLVVRDDTFTASGKLTITRGELDMGGQALNISGSVIIANVATAAITVTGNVTFGSGMDIGAAGNIFLTGANLTLNGIDQQIQFSRTITEDETVSINNSYLRNLTIGASSGVTLTSSQIQAFGTLTINTGSVLALGANTLGNTGGTIFNYGLLREDTGKVVNTGTLLNFADSNYADVSEVKTEQTVHITFREDDENINGTAADTLSVTITTAAGDSESLTLTETTNTSRIFRGSLPTAKVTAATNDGTLQTTADTTLTVSFTDAQDALINTDTVTFTAVGGTTSAGGGGGGRGSGGGGGGGGGGTSVNLVEKLVDAQQKAKEETSRQARLEARIEGGDLGERGILEAKVDGKNVAFKDIPVKEWFAEFVLRVIDAGIASGYKDARGRLTGTF